LETVERDYAPKGVQFYYIYKSLAHPENNGYVTPFSLEERLMHVAEAKRTLGSRIPWLCDTMDNQFKHELGNRPNSEFVIDPEGKIVSSRDWSNPTALREDLERLVGKVDSPTLPADLNMPQRKPPERAPTGIVKRIQLPGQMSPVKIEALESNTPHYAKLRAELSSDQLYLGFFLDPLYKVHWNNKAPTLSFSISAPDEITVTPTEGKASIVKVDADADPREFLVTVSGSSPEPMKVVVQYFACDDAETFCIPVTQEYLVTMERDPDGGSRRSAGGRRRQGGTRGSSSRSGFSGQSGRSSGRDGGASSPQNSNRMREMIRRVPVLSALDQNEDGILSADEIERAPDLLRQVDRNGDGQITASETAPRPPESQRRPPGRSR
jgi:uncharacterized membrane protein YgcG